MRKLKNVVARVVRPVVHDQAPGRVWIGAPSALPGNIKAAVDPEAVAAVASPGAMIVFTLSREFATRLRDEMAALRAVDPDTRVRGESGITIPMDDDGGLFLGSRASFTQQHLAKEVLAVLGFKTKHRSGVTIYQLTAEDLDEYAATLTALLSDGLH